MSDISDQRRYYERMIDEIAAVHRQQIDQLRAENAKLRELVGIVFGRLQAAEDATDMGWIDARLLDRMQELGVDV